MELKLNWKCLPKTQRDLWDKVAGVKELKKFYLAGGTALALHLGHRESVDFDFFCSENLSSATIIKSLSKIGSVKVNLREMDTLYILLKKVKLSFIAYKYPMISAPLIFEGIRVAAVEDIIPMKLIAASERGSRKDFIDLWMLLQSGWNIHAMLELLPRKFPGVEYNRVHIFKSLTYFVDAEQENNPKVFVDISWEQIKRDLTEAVDEIR